MPLEKEFERQDSLNIPHQEVLRESETEKTNKKLADKEEDINYIHNELKALSIETHGETKEASKLTRGDRYTLQVEADARSIFIGNITYDVTPEIIEEHFAKCGEIKKITLLHDKHTGIPKGYAYVQFESSEVRKKALKLNGTELKGNNINVYKKRTNIPGYHRYSQYQSPFCYPTQWNYSYNAFPDLKITNFLPPYSLPALRQKDFDRLNSFYYRGKPSNSYRGKGRGNGSRRFYRHDIRFRENSQSKGVTHHHHQHILEPDQETLLNKKPSLAERRNESITPTYS